MKPIKSFFLPATLLALVACSEQPAASSITINKASETDGCLYAGKLFSAGALKISMKTAVNAAGEQIVVEDPEGILLQCVKGGPGGYWWTTDHPYQTDVAMQVSTDGTREEVK